ncbi:glycoside hydrolase family 3 C-terminal domain-containing protein [Ramlibacter sp. 2FC]|uniref:beta-glucosidase n=1 Tax=Ramlibacter sp. 2FC TaxID=2502188 RepID=UPI0014852096|nr:glycoside hydrolase family 3 C-terminal domain-containing protein [Ramlibacter sp. 2FC]
MSSACRRMGPVALAAMLALSACDAGADAASESTSRQATLSAARTNAAPSASLSPEARAQALVDSMTLEEKSALLYGYGTKAVGGQTWQVYVKGNARLGIPDMVQGDAPSGIWQGSAAVTQMPNSAALAASFSREVAHAYGETLGAQTRALGYGVLHGPNVDVLRDPRHGRAHESFGEDPYLVAQTATAYVKGLQSHRVIADAKHFAVNTVEKDRTRVDAVIDNRTLHELYTAPFQDVVQDARVGMVMCAYTKINGVQACDHEDLLNGLLRRAWGFEGIVRTDAGAAHALQSLRYGVDQEFRSESQFGKVLIEAVRAGTFPLSAVDEAVKRILRTMIAYGIYDDPPQRTGADLQAGAAVAQQVAEHAIVLLRNQGGLLPLDASRLQRIALIGTSVDDTLTAGGPANPAPQGKDTILQAIRDRVPGAVVLHARGVDPIYPIAVAPGYPQLPSGALTAEDGSSRGASAVYHAADGSRLASRVDTCLCYTPANNFSSSVTARQDPPAGTTRASWTATLQAEVAGSYGFDLATNGAAQLFIGGRLVAKTEGRTDLAPAAVELQLAQGAHAVRVEYALGAAPSPQLKVGWRAPSAAMDANIRAAAEAAARADVAIVVARDLESESVDRPSLTLPNDQDRMVQAVARANPRTIVVLTTGSAVTTPWNAQVPAMLEAWYGGTRGGAALARVLFGDINPSGRLPVSFPRADADLPTYAPEQFPGVNQVQRFSEGLRIGYRHFNTPGTPRAEYPFGFGLSYTHFAYSDLVLDRVAFNAGTAGADGTLKGRHGVTATFTVTNTGRRAGAVVPQLYVEYPRAAGEPTPLLKGYDKVELRPGESKRVSIALDQRAFSVYDASAGKWAVVPGSYRLAIGDSSVDAALLSSVQVRTGSPQ